MQSIHGKAWKQLTLFRPCILFFFFNVSDTWAPRCASAVSIISASKTATGSNDGTTYISVAVFLHPSCSRESPGEF